MFLNRFKYLYVAQLSEQDCGVASLSMILKYFNSDYSLEYLKKLSMTDIEGTTALGIIEAAKKLGLDTKAVKANTQLFDMDKIPLPFIIHVNKNMELLHYYVVLKIERDYVLIADPDPDIGIIKLSKEQLYKEWTGISIFFKSSQEYKVYKQKKRHKPLHILVKQKKIIFKLTCLSLIITIVNILSSFFLQFMIDTIIPRHSFKLLSVLSISLIITYFWNSVIFYYRQIIVTIFGQNLSLEITLKYIHYLFELPISFFSTRKTGELVSRFNESSKITDALGSTVISIVLDFSMVIFTGVFLFIQNKLLFSISLMSIPFYGAIIYFFGRKFNDYNYETMEQGSVLDSSVIEGIKGIETIKTLNNEDRVLHSIDKKFQNLLKSSLKFTKVLYIQESMRLALDLIFNAVILWIGGNLIMKGKMTVGQLVGYTVLLSFFTSSLKNIINLQPKLQTSNIANKRLNEVYSVEPESSEQREITDMSLIRGDIHLHNLYFNYYYQDNTLLDINLKIKQYSKIAIVGMSGSGKSTLAKLLVGLLDIEKSQDSIMLNNSKIQDIDRKVLRSYIHYLPQQTSFFSGTIKENLSLNNKKTVADIKTALKAAEILDDIEKFPNKLETKLVENNSILSLGQLQRLSIARSLLSDAEVLILDESTSNLDTITEQKILNNLLMFKNKTIIFIAHRLTVAKQTEYIFVLEKGHIVEQGHHKELIAKKEKYYSYFNSNA